MKREEYAFEERRKVCAVYMVGSGSVVDMIRRNEDGNWLVKEAAVFVDRGNIVEVWPRNAPYVDLAHAKAAYVREQDRKDRLNERLRAERAANPPRKPWYRRIFG